MTGGADLVIGFDLDMTLIDSRPGVAATYRALNERLGTALPAEDLAAIAVDVFGDDRVLVEPSLPDALDRAVQQAEEKAI